MAAARHSVNGWLTAFQPRHLTLGLGVIVTVAVLITEIVFLVPASYHWHKANESDAIEDVRQAWYHASDPARFLTATDKARLGERMIRDGLILGGTVFDPAGDPLVVFGERPLLNLNMARLSGITRQQSPSSAALDVLLRPEDTGMAHPIVVRLPMAPIEATTLREVRNFGLSVLFIASLTSLLFIAASLFYIVRPLRAINTALRNAVENPNRADSFQTNLSRRDEIGQISRSLGMLLTSVSVSYQEELAAMKAAIECFGYGIIQYDHEGRMIAANPAAKKAFKANTFEDLRSMNPNCAQPLGSARSVPRPLLDVLGDSEAPMLITLHRDDSFFSAMAYVAVIRRPDGSVAHRFAAFMEMDDVLGNTRKALNRSKKLETDIADAQLEMQEMRRLLESCLCLLDNRQPGEDEYRDSFLPDRILNSWYSEAKRDGLVSGTLEHGLLPPLSGDTVAIRNVLRQGMLLAYAKAQDEKPVLKVDASRQRDGTILFVIRDVSEARQAHLRPRKKAVDPTLPAAALASALNMAGGQQEHIPVIMQSRMRSKSLFCRVSGRKTGSHFCWKRSSRFGQKVSRQSIVARSQKRRASR
jgi:PAS domain-containing protein